MRQPAGSSAASCVLRFRALGGLRRWGEHPWRRAGPARTGVPATARCARRRGRCRAAGSWPHSGRRARRWSGAAPPCGRARCCWSWPCAAPRRAVGQAVDRQRVGRLLLQPVRQARRVGAQAGHEPREAGLRLGARGREFGNDGRTLGAWFGEGDGGVTSVIEFIYGYRQDGARVLIRSYGDDYAPDTATVAGTTLTVRAQFFRRPSVEPYVLVMRYVRQ